MGMKLGLTRFFMCSVPQGLGHGLYGVAALTATGVCALLVAVLRRRPKKQPCNPLHITRL